MKLWISGEVDSDIGDAFHSTMNIIESKVNKIIETKDYNSGLDSWDVIFIITSQGGKEICRFSKKNRETDIRLVIDHDSFKKATSDQQLKMFLKGLLRSIRLLQQKKIENLNLDQLYLDIEILL